MNTIAETVEIDGLANNMYSLYCKYPNNKICAIKEFRRLTSCSLSEGKHYIDTYYKSIDK